MAIMDYSHSSVVVVVLLVVLVFVGGEEFNFLGENWTIDADK